MSQWTISGALTLAGGAQPALAQTVTDTISDGERYESISTSEVGNGSVSFEAIATLLIGGQSVELAALPNRYGSAYTSAEVAAALPVSLVQSVGGVEVVVTAFAAPNLIDTQEELVGYFVSNDYRTYTLFETSVQWTSGDGPDALVPTGSRGFCTNGGTSGETNYGAFAGAFADCEAGEVVAVAAGTINRNSHTTSVYVDEYSTFEIFDYAYNGLFTVLPASSESWSAGTLDEVGFVTRTVRSDSFETGFIGLLGDTVLFDQTVAARSDNPQAQALLADLSRPTGVAVDGAPAIVTWSAPVRTAASAVLLSTDTATATATADEQVRTVTTTIGLGGGETVLIGDRGQCSSTGSSGTVNGPLADGANATCAGGVAYSLAPGEVNTNTHVTTVTRGTVTTTTTERWLTAETFRLAATATAIGQGHAAIADGLFEDAREFSALHSASLGQRSGVGVGPWLAAFTGDGSRHGRGGAPGWSRNRDGLAGGVTMAVSELAKVGVSVARSATDMRLDDGGGRATLKTAQMMLGAIVSPGRWTIEAAAGRGWTKVATRRGSAALGGVSTAGYRADSWFALARAGPTLGIGGAELHPYAGLDWSRAATARFTEVGGVPLTGRGASLSRAEARLGAAIGAGLGMPGSWGARIDADLAAGTAIGTHQRRRQVAFVADPASLLTVTSARAPGLFADAELGVALTSPGGLKIRLGGGGRLARGNDSWQASAAAALTF